MTHDEELLRAYADERLRHSANDIGVAFAGDVTEHDREGRRFRMLATDGSEYATIMVAVAGSRHAGDLSAEALEAAVERRSGSYAREHRLRDLAANAVVLRRDELV